MPDLQQYPWNLISVSFPIASYKQVSFAEKLQMKISSLKKKKH